MEREGELVCVCVCVCVCVGVGVCGCGCVSVGFVNHQVTGLTVFIIIKNIFLVKQVHNHYSKRTLQLTKRFLTLVMHEWLWLVIWCVLYVLYMLYVLYGACTCSGCLIRFLSMQSPPLF
jgi:hypothetical protein